MSNLSNSPIQKELLRYSTKNGYVVQHFAEAQCICGNKVFNLSLDDTEGCAVRKCLSCSHEHPMGDSKEYLSQAQLDECACPCGQEAFGITAGVALYEESDDVRWIYVGCTCISCGMAAVCGDWKNEFENYRELLANI
jgi:hypothetical protein